MTYPSSSPPAPAPNPDRLTAELVDLMVEATRSGDPDRYLAERGRDRAALIREFDALDPQAVRLALARYRRPRA